MIVDLMMKTTKSKGFAFQSTILYFFL